MPGPRGAPLPARDPQGGILLFTPDQFAQAYGGLSVQEALKHLSAQDFGAAYWNSCELTFPASSGH